MKLGRPLFTTDMSGSVGGCTAAKARGGLLYLRSRVTPSNPRSGNQSRMRLILSGIAAAWRGTLTGTQRASWAALAGDNESGIDAFVKVNSQVVLAGGDRVDTPPASITLDAPPPSALVVDASDHAVKITPVTFGDDIWGNVFVSSSKQNASRLSQQFPYTYLGTVHFADASQVTIDFNTIAGLVGAAAGDIVYVRLVTVDINGKVAIPFETRKTVQA